MITVKLKLQNQPEVKPYIKQYNNIVRFAYNKLKQGTKQSETEKAVKSTMNHIELMDASFVKAAVDNARSLNVEQPVIFGGKRNWQRYNKGLISKEEYQNNKLKPLTVRGSSQDSKGNRKFQLDLVNHQIIFKPSRNTKFYLTLPETKQDKNLIKLQKLCEAGETYFTCGISQDHVYITFDETILKKNKYRPIASRVCAIDLNPNYIGLVVKDDNRIYHKEIIGLRELNKQKTNKKKFEDYEVSKRLVNIAEHYRCEYFIYEKLDIKSSDKGQGKMFNKLCNNDWRRKRILGNLGKRCNILGIKVQEVIPQYSSFVGQIDNENEYDSIAAAIELGRRGLLFIRKFIEHKSVDVKGQIVRINNKLSEDLADRWKKKLNLSSVLGTYAELYQEIKKLRYSYRVLFQFDWFSCRLKSRKSHVFVHVH